MENLDCKNLKKFIAGYKEAALWSSVDINESGECFDNLEGYELSTQAENELASNAIEFFKANIELISEFCTIEQVGYDYAGHSFWLNHNGHGAGFFDYSSNAASELDRLSRSYSEVYLYVGDDGLVYC